MANFEIEFNGKTYDVEAPDADAAYKAFAEAMQIDDAVPKGEGDGILRTMGKALQHGVAAQVDGYGNTARAAGATDVGKGVNSIGAGLAPKNYETASDKVGLNPKTWGNVPQAIVESAPGLATDIAAGGAGGLAGSIFGPIGTAVGGLGGFGASFAARQFGNNVKDRVKTNDPTKDIEDATSNDMKIAGLSTAGEAALNRVGLGKALSSVPKGAGLSAVAQIPGQIAKSAGAEAVGGAAGNVVNQIGRTAGTEQGLSIDPNEVGSAGVLGGAAGAAVRGARAPKDLSQASRLSGFQADPDSTARVVGKLGESEGGVSSPKDAFRAVDNIQRDLIEQRKTAQSSAKEFLNSQDSHRELVQKNIKRLEEGQLLTSREMNKLEAALGQHADTAPLLDNIRDQNTVNRLKRLGNFDEKSETFGGGLQNTAIGRMTNPLKLKSLGAGGIAEAAMALAPKVVGGAVGLPTGAIAGAGVAANLGMRGIDAMRGTKNPTAELVNRFSDMGQPEAPAQNLPSYESPARMAREAAAREQMLAKLSREEVKADEGRERDNIRALAAEARSREAAFKKMEAARRADESATAKRSVQEDRAWNSREVDPRKKAAEEAAMWKGNEATKPPARPNRDWSEQEATQAIQSTLRAREMALRLSQKGQAGEQADTPPRSPSPGTMGARKAVDPTPETHFQYEGLWHPRPDKTINTRGWEAATAKNQQTIIRTLDSAIGEGVEVKTGEAIMKHTPDLRTARSQEEARIVISRILKDSDPDDRPQVRKALLDPNFLSTWKKPKRGP